MVLGVCILLTAAVFVVFGQTLRYAFVNFDDKDYFYSNPQVQAGLTWNGAIWAFQTVYASNWHPLTWLSLMLDAELFGTSPAGPHLVNVILHAVNTVLLFLLLKRLTGTLWPSAFVAAGFAIHPLHVESVAWVSERKDVLSGFFFMLTLLMYARYVEKSKVRSPNSKVFYGLTLLFFALGLMSKPMLVTLPFVLLLLDYWPLQRFGLSTSNLQPSICRRLVVEKLPFFLLSAISCVITVLAQREAVTPTVALPLFLRIGNALVSYVIYLGQMFYPVGLAAFYPHPEKGLSLWKIVLSSVFLAGIIAGAFALRRRRPYLLVGWLWYLGTLVPVIGLLQVGGQARADRYTYLPLIGMFILITWTAMDLLSFWRSRHQALGFVSFIVIAALMVGASIQTSYWRNSKSLWTHALSCVPRNYVADNGLGVVLAGQDQNTEAIGHYQTALEIKPDYAVAHNNIGIVLARQGQNMKAIEHYQKALELKPDYVEAHINLGNVLAGNDRLNEAIEHYQRALQLNPNCAEAHNDWGAMLLARGRTAEAMEHFRRAVELMPNDAEMQINLGTVLATLGHASEAIEYYRKALELKPDYAKAHYNLANIFAAQGRLDEAIEHYQRALEQMPDFTHARYQFGLVLQSRGKFAAAIAQFRKILELDPKHVPAQNNLAWLLATCPDNSLRNGATAVELAQQAVQLSDGKSPEIFDTLAAAYAEAGRFPEAIETAKRALDLPATKNNKPLAEAIQSRLRLYEANTPCHEKP